VQPIRSAHEPTPSPQAEQPGQKRVRVSVRTSVRDSDLLVVRPLAEGEAAPAGTREAYLVMSDVVAVDPVRANGSVG
jgi:hypothetical protein